MNHSHAFETVISIPWDFKVDKVESACFTSDIKKKTIFICPDTKRVKVICKIIKGIEILVMEIQLRDIRKNTREDIKYS